MNKPKMDIKQARKYVQVLKATPFHPQWAVFQAEKKAHGYIAELIKADSRVIDIGCGHREIESLIPNSCSYIGVDLYETSKNWYQSKPDVYGDAQCIPVKSDSSDYVLMLEVLEHIENPDLAIAEATRLLDHTGTYIASIPFIYPLHDEPYDYRRWTRHGLKQLIESNNKLNITHIIETGGSITSSSVLFNLSITERFLKLLKLSKLSALLLPFLAILFLVSNLLSMIDKVLLPKNSIAPLGYLIIASKE